MPITCLKTDVHLNFIQNLCFYLKENIFWPYYKEYPVIPFKKGIGADRENHTTHKHNNTVLLWTCVLQKLFVHTKKYTLLKGKPRTVYKMHRLYLGPSWVIIKEYQ